MVSNPEFININCIKQAVEEMLKIGCSGINIMAPKAIHRIIKLHGIRTPIGNIIKQEMLAVGGEAAVNCNTVNCKAETTDVLLMGTLSQYRIFLMKMKNQVSECKSIAEEVEKILESQTGLQHDKENNL